MKNIIKYILNVLCFIPIFGIVVVILCVRCQRELKEHKFWAYYQLASIIIGWIALIIGHSILKY